MDIELDKRGDSLKIIVDGNIDEENGHKFSASLREAMEMEGLRRVVLDLATVRTVSSSGIGKLLNFNRFMGGKGGSVAIEGISDRLYEQFLEIHLDRVLPISK